MNNLEASYANAARRQARLAKSKQCTVQEHGPCSPTGIRTAHPGPYARTTDLPPQQPLALDAGGVERDEAMGPIPDFASQIECDVARYPDA